MGTKGKLSGFDFVKMVEEARTYPDMLEGGPRKVIEILPPIKDPKVEENPHVERKIPDDKITVETHYLSHSKVFVLWRPWEACTRCTTAFQSDILSLPTDGDYICPHTSNDEYRKTVDSFLKGDALITLRESFTLQDGTRCMHMEWLTIDPVQLKKQKQLEREREENQVYPPNLEKAFRKN